MDGEARLSAAARRDLAQTIYEQALHMSELTSNVLDMARLESGAVQFNRQWHPFDEVIGPVFARLRKRLEGREVNVDVSRAPPLVWLDNVLIGQVLTNLLDNALKYTPAGTPIDLTLSPTDRGVEVSVRDYGPGLAPGEEERVFDKFYRAHPEGTPGGAGLGLAICRAAVAAHEGRIWAENLSDGGVRFVFRLPQPPLPPGPRAEATPHDD